MNFNDYQLKKNDQKVCITCKVYYNGPYCSQCYNNTYNLYRTTTLLEKWNITPGGLFTKLLLIFSQIQTLYPWLHLIDYDYVLHKLLKYLKVPLFLTIGYTVKNTFVWHIILKAIVAGVIIIL